MLLTTAVPSSAQEFRGRINGTVTDNTGAVLPGVTVTATSPALIQPQVQVTGSEGDYRFIALPPGVYDLTFELAGFQTVKREGIRVVINQTLTVDQQLQVATLQETVTVTGESPDRRHLDDAGRHELHQGTPHRNSERARHLGGDGAGARPPDDGLRRRRLAHGHADGLLVYGFGDQNQTKLEGIDTTEGTGANAGYFDFGSFEEFQVGGAGSGADSFAGGAELSITSSPAAIASRATGTATGTATTPSATTCPDAFRTANNARRGRVLQHARR